jgi:hypothetical protein
MRDHLKLFSFYFVFYFIVLEKKMDIFFLNAQQLPSPFSGIKLKKLPELFRLQKLRILWYF